MAPVAKYIFDKVLYTVVYNDSALITLRCRDFFAAVILLYDGFVTSSRHLQAVLHHLADARMVPDRDRLRRALGHRLKGTGDELLGDPGGQYPLSFAGLGDALVEYHRNGPPRRVARLNFHYRANHTRDGQPI